MTDESERKARHSLSIITPVFDPPRAAFEACVRSVLAQDYNGWEWCLADDRSSAPWVWPRLQQLAARDTRIKVTRRDVNGGISAASNSALELATGDFVVLLDNDDELTPDALGAINHELWIGPEVDYIYSDEQKVDEEGNFFHHFEKPDWSPERLLCQNYCTHISALRRSIVEDVGGFRSEYNGAQDYDIVLRVTERARKVVHIPRVLYHWRALEGSTATSVDAKPYAVAAGQRAVADALDRRGIAGEVVDVGHGYHRVRRELTATPKVSIVIPTRGTVGRIWGLDLAYVVNLVDSLRISSYENIEVIVVYDTEMSAETLDAIKRRSPFPMELIEYGEPFNFSEKCNIGALTASGEILMFLNDDMEILSEDWVERMVSFLQDPTVGLVGPLLLLDNFLIQSAGHTAAPPTHFAMRLPPSAGGGGGRPLDLNREVTGITGACMAVRRQTFFDVGGLSLDFPLNFNDVDFGFKITERGLRIIWTPDARLFHFESKSRITDVSLSELDRLEQLWGRFMRRDRFLPHTSEHLLVEDPDEDAPRSDGFRIPRRPIQRVALGSSAATSGGARTAPTRKDAPQRP